MTKGYADWNPVVYEYDDANRMTYSMPAWGNLTEVDHNQGGITEYVYDDNGRLTLIGEEPQYQNFDQKFEYDGLSRLTTSYLAGSESPTFTYNYDALNRRTHVATEYKYNPEGAYSVISQYDGRQERAQFSNDTTNEVGQSQLEAYRSLNYIPNHIAGMYGQLISQELHQSDRPEFLPSGHEDILDGTQRQQQFFHQDHLNSTVGLTDQEGLGTVNYHYGEQGDSWVFEQGEWPAQGTDSQWLGRHTNPYMYTGKYTEHSSKMVNMDARWYSPRTGRFTSPDYYNLQQLSLPAGARHQLVRAMGLNAHGLLRDPAQQMRYGYVSGNIVSFGDPSGLSGAARRLPSQYDSNSNLNNKASITNILTYVRSNQPEFTYNAVRAMGQHNSQITYTSAEVAYLGEIYSLFVNLNQCKTNESLQGVINDNLSSASGNSYGSADNFSPTLELLNQHEQQFRNYLAEGGKGSFEHWLKIRGTNNTASSSPQSLIKRKSWPASVHTALGKEAPVGMENPHRHHILPLNGREGEERTLIREGQQILLENGIDPVFGVENLVWAPNKGHTVKTSRDLVEDLRDANELGLGRDEMAEILKGYGIEASNR